MMFTIMVNEKLISFAKSINYIGKLCENEIEITEEQYNEMTEFPLKLTIENGKVISWEKTTIEYEPIPETPKTPKEATVEEYLIDLDFRVSLIELGLGV